MDSENRKEEKKKRSKRHAESEQEQVTFVVENDDVKSEKTEETEEISLNESSAESMSENGADVTEGDLEDEELRDLAVYPTHEFVLFPGNTMKLSIEDPRRLGIIRHAVRENANLFVLSLAKLENYLQNPEELKNTIGVEARVLRCDREPRSESLTVTLLGVRRCYLRNLFVKGELFYAQGEVACDIPLSIIGEDMFTDQSLLRSVRQAAKSILESKDANRNMRDILQIIGKSREAGQFCDFLSSVVDMPYVMRLRLLQTLSVRHRLQLLLRVFSAHNEADSVFKETAQGVREDLERQQREYFIRQHIKALRDQIQDPTPDPMRDEEEILAKMKDLDASEEVKNYIAKQYKRMSYLSLASAEYSVARNHIETLLDIPWRKKTEDCIDLVHAREILDEDHYGLEKVKERIIEYLAVLALRQDMKAPILCLYGPPGVGKTSIGKSVARALGRQFERISLGGIHDESEIRGHRRTYIGSMPGRIIQAIRHAGTINPVIMLDEIDKLSVSPQGDPASALLEVLDPEQHHAFVDNYVETAVDLSSVLFLTTANSLDTIPGPLRDRMEILEIPGYTQIEKHRIAEEFLLPKVQKAHGLTKSSVSVSSDALDDMISYYTREAGVRHLEHCLSGICRKAAAHVVSAKQSGKRRTALKVTRKNLSMYLGKPKYDYAMIEADRLPGISTGLAWTPVGGDILFIETTRMPGKGNLVITGKLGDVMQESIRAAMTLIRTRGNEMGIEPEVFEKTDIHVHVPAGATPKDGPSAGVAIFSALYSLFTERSIPATIAMTGEISLRGNVLPVGGIREKVLAAHRAGVRTILMPERNKIDLDEVPEEVRKDLKFHFLKTIDDGVKIVFPAK